MEWINALKMAARRIVTLTLNGLLTPDLPTLANGGEGIAGADLHAISLLELFKAKPELQQLTLDIPALLPAFFQPDGGKKGTGIVQTTGNEDDKPNLLEQLLRPQFGTPGTGAGSDGMLDGFIAELRKLFEGGTMQQFEDGAAVSGGHSFTISDIAKTFNAGDSKTLADAQVNQLIGAMASYPPPGDGQMTLPLNYQTGLEPVIAASWH